MRITTTLSQRQQLLVTITEGTSSNGPDVIYRVPSHSRAYSLFLRYAGRTTQHSSPPFVEAHNASSLAILHALALSPIDSSTVEYPKLASLLEKINGSKSVQAGR